MRHIILSIISLCLWTCAYSQACFNSGDGSDGAFVATSNTTLAGGSYDFTSFTISPGITVTGTGNTPIIIRVTGDVLIEGTLSVKGGNGANGVVNITYGGGGIGVAGGSNGGNGSYNNFNSAASADWGYGIGGGGNGEEYGGGGGGGYGTSGTSSGNTAGGWAGSAYGDAQISTLYGGSGGGGGSGGFGGGGGGGGAGGGAIEISCGGTVTIASGGIINANGGNGGNAGTHVGGGGGGAGGSILIKGVEVINNGLITAVGGTGGFSQSFAFGRIGGNGGDGRIKIDHDMPLSGSGSYTPAIGSEQALATAPVVQAMASPGTTVCEGSTLTLYADGNASSYTWSDGVEDGVAFTPVNEGWYVLTASSGGACTVSDSIYITITPNPSLNPVAIPGTDLCEGESVTLSAGDADNYIWSEGVLDDVAFTPAFGGWYLVSATTDGCTSVDSIYLTIVPYPPLNPTAIPGNILCAGESITLSGGGNAAFYTWSNGVEDGVPFIPAASGTYNVEASNGSFCVATGSIEIIVNDNPVIDLGEDILTETLPVTLDAGAGFAVYVWSTEEETQSISVDEMGTYSVTVFDGNGCSASDSIEVIQTIGIAESAIEAITLYPNPAVDVIRIQTEQSIGALRIINGTGKIVRELNQLQRSIDVADLPSGIYFIEVMMDEGIQRVSFVKQ